MSGNEESQSFKFELLAKVSIRPTNEHGVVFARAQHYKAEDQYLVHYRRADGCAAEAWWRESVLHMGHAIG